MFSARELYLFGDALLDEMQRYVGATEVMPPLLRTRVQMGTDIRHPAELKIVILAELLVFSIF